ncbi:MAG TPA: cytochrome c oxidase subunit 4 [Acidimicrobiales bacterium]|nr:cytochrome c oxidase subunit 4 [Acidimicrobiales bacterium]
MKHEWILALGASLFLALTAVVYFAWSGETSGTVMLIFGCLAYALLGGFLLLVFLRRHHVPRAEDRPDATMEDGAGEISFFPGNSIWPVAMGLAAISLAIGLAFGKWFWAIGAILLLGTIIGFAVEAESH